uniref:Uncharacterized protein n=1 Tax=Anguilla anguilla TaxID=7936 RepID=A0A0E9RVX7_ANGAN
MKNKLCSVRLELSPEIFIRLKSEITRFHLRLNARLHFANSFSVVTHAIFRD